VTHVVVIGAGYAGAHAARRARTDGARVTVVDPTGRHGFTPRYAAVAAGRAGTGDLTAPLDALIDVEVVTDVARTIDPTSRTVTLAAGGRLAYDALVVTTGAEPVAPPVAGLRDHGLVLASDRDALTIRATVQRVVEHGVGVVIVGGGATGVQLAAEIAHQHPDLPVTLIEREPRLLPAEPRVLGRAAGRILRSAGVRVRLGVGVATVDSSGAVLDDGSRHDGVVAWAGGWRARGSTLLPDAPTEGGRLVVDADLTILGLDGVFAAGDTAAHRDVLGRQLAMSAQIASQAGEVAGRNAVAWAQGRSLRSALLVELGRVLDLGGGVGVGRVGPVHLARRPFDRLVPALHLAIDLRHLWQLAGITGVLDHAPGRARDLVDEQVTRELRAVS
jgi:NADH:ubiquinone reductase (H+-translocating)